MLGENGIKLKYVENLRVSDSTFNWGDAPDPGLNEFVPSELRPFVEHMFDFHTLEMLLDVSELICKFYTSWPKSRTYLSQEAHHAIINKKLAVARGLPHRVRPYDYFRWLGANYDVKDLAWKKSFFAVFEQATKNSHNPYPFINLNPLELEIFSSIGHGFATAPKIGRTVRRDDANLRTTLAALVRHGLLGKSSNKGYFIREQYYYLIPVKALVQKLGD